jgi:hypothetical protein
MKVCQELKIPSVATEFYTKKKKEKIPPDNSTPIFLYSLYITKD